MRSSKFKHTTAISITNTTREYSTRFRTTHHQWHATVYLLGNPVGLDGLCYQCCHEQGTPPAIYRMSQEEWINFGRVFLMLHDTDITQNTYIQSWTVTEIMAREKCCLLAGSTHCTWPAVPSALPDTRNQGVSALRRPRWGWKIRCCACADRRARTAVSSWGIICHVKCLEP